jgi:hypothetical protein
MGEAEDDGAFFYGMQAEDAGRIHLTPDGVVDQHVASARQAALEAVTEATREVVTANHGLFTAMRERQARRKEALDLGATLAEVQAAIAAGQPAGWAST